MKILTWNVNGLRAVLNKGAGEWFRSHLPDVICLQEIKTRPEQLAEKHLSLLEDYQATWHPAEKPGYSGTATLLRHGFFQEEAADRSPMETVIGLNIPEYDREGRVIRTRFPGFWLYNIYFPSGQRGHDRVDFKLDFYRSLLEICDRHHQEGEKLVICGDFNTAHREIDLRNPKSNVHTSGFLPEERAWIDRYLEHGFTDAFRALYPERVQYTWWTYISNARERNVGWRLDYFLVSKDLMPCVREVTVHQDILGSDHCPVTLEIDYVN